MYFRGESEQKKITDREPVLPRGGQMRIKTNPDYKYRKIAGLHYLIPCAEAAARSRTPLELTETASWIWQRAEAGEDSEKIAAGMTEEFEVDPETAIQAVNGFMELLLQRGMAESEDR